MNKVVSKILAQLFFMFQHNQGNHLLSTPPIVKKRRKSTSYPKKKQTGKQMNFIRTFKINLKNAHLNREYTLFN